MHSVLFGDVPCLPALRLALIAAGDGEAKEQG